MFSREHRQQAAQAMLARYAVPISGGGGRVHPEAEDASRFPLQRDRDRIIHCQAFRRLQGKTQVFVAGAESDHVRTRLTHTMEVAQLSRDMARTLGLNEDLAECLALAHDLGHPPFGHAGEDALDRWMRKRGKRFEHNEQSHRVVTVLEQHSHLWPGLNLRREVLNGLKKHARGSARAPLGIASSFEAQLVNMADELAYCGHDVEDGLRAGLFTLAETQDVPLLREAFAHAKRRGTPLRGAIVDLLVTDLYTATAPRLTRAASPRDAVHALIDIPRVRRNDLAVLRRFLVARMYRHPRVLAATKAGQRLILSLCDALLQEPTEKIMELKALTGGSLVVAVKDYVAGMTDTYVRQQAALLHLASA